jgi:hypothetical protein
MWLVLGGVALYVVTRSNAPSPLWVLEAEPESADGFMSTCKKFNGVLDGHKCKFPVTECGTVKTVTGKVFEVCGPTTKWNWDSTRSILMPDGTWEVLA